MPLACSVFGCNVKHVKGNFSIRFFVFPSDPDIAKRWVFKCCRLDPINPTTARICSNHFSPSQYARNLKVELLNPNLTKEGLQKKLSLSVDALPDINLPTPRARTSIKGANLEVHNGRANRRLKRQQRCMVDELLQGSGRNSKRITKKSGQRYIQAVASLLENEEVSLGSHSSSNGQTFTIGQTPANQFTSSCQSPISGDIFPNGPTPLSGAYPPPPSAGDQIVHVEDVYVKEEPEERVISAAQLLHLSGYEAGGGGSTLLKDEHCQDLNLSLLEMKMEATEEFFDDPAFLISPAKL